MGTVTKVEGTSAKVLVKKKTACDGCTQGSCEATQEGMIIDALNPVQAKEGQTVKVLMAPEDYLKGSIMVYGIPLVFFILGSIAGKIIAVEYFPLMNSDLIAALAGFAALILTLAGIKVWSKGAESSSEKKPVIEEIVN